MKCSLIALGLALLIGCAARDGAAASAARGGGTESKAAASSRPNVIVILADDLGYADLGCQGSTDVKTPHIDSIAANGVRFTNGYASCPVCAPTRTGLLTGRYQQRFGFEQNPSPRTPPNYGLPVDEVTLANVLKDHGYVTGAIGKWHLGFEPEHHPMSRGFDEYFGFLAGAHDYFKVMDGKNPVLRGREPVEKIEYMTDDFSREAASFVQRHASGEKPFFLYLAYSAVHTPMQVPQHYLERFKGVKDEKRHQLLAMLAAMDDGVGQVLDRVRAAGEEDNTLVIFLSDNGGPTGGNASRNDPFSGFKNGTREGGIRVPYLMQWKAKVPAGKTYDKTLISMDVFSTVAAAAGARSPTNKPIDGVDLVPYVTGSQDGTPHETLYWRYGEKWAIRDGDYKLLHNEAGPPKLYNLSKDPDESEDLAEKLPDVRKQLRGKYDKWSGQMIEPLWKDFREKPLGAPRPPKNKPATPAQG
jgi:arylsulfatase A-like enzyme